jgi:hypothetical protein
MVFDFESDPRERLTRYPPRAERLAQPGKWLNCKGCVMIPWDWPMMITGSAPRSAAAYLSFFSIAASDDSTPPKAETMQFNVAFASALERLARPCLAFVARLDIAARTTIRRRFLDAVFPGCLVRDVGV